VYINLTIYALGCKLWPSAANMRRVANAPEIEAGGGCALGMNVWRSSNPQEERRHESESCTIPIEQA
jgi:hypothetical protein